MRILFLLMIMMILMAGHAQDISSRYFEDCGVTGSFTLYDAVRDKWITSDPADQYLQTLPASTFKIVNSLIALEEGAVENEEVILPWPGQEDTTHYSPRPDIYHDMNMTEAYRKSAVWFYVEMARRIGRETYARYIKALDYGNQDLSEEYIDFWNFGKLGISPREQIELLRRLEHGNLPFSSGTIHRVKDIMLEKQSYEYVLRSKTGLTEQDGETIGWYVGYLLTDGGEYYFATRIRKPAEEENKDFNECRKRITLSMLKELGVIM